ncbi:FecR domain-containing protein [Planctomycetales bacterium ZRK34]|nr:FecR domain-containing protein [Planctomycetales bacterium ZRK34]
MLADDLDAQRRYVQYLMLCDALRRCCDQSEHIVEPISPPVVRANRRERLRRLAFAAVILLAVALGIMLPQRSRETDRVDTLPKAAVATLTTGAFAVWQGQPVHAGQTLSEGRLTFDSGLGELFFHDGGSITLEGPAELELISGNACRLISGQMTADIPPQAVGFTVLTRGLQIVDLGTRFHVRVDDQGATHVGVLEGHVSVQFERGETAPVILAAGTSGRFDGTTNQYELNRVASLNYIAPTSLLIDFINPQSKAAYPARSSETDHWNTVSKLNSSQEAMVDILGRPVSLSITTRGFTGIRDNDLRKTSVDWADPTALAGVWGIYEAYSPSDVATIQLSNLVPGRAYDVSLIAARSEPPEPNASRTRTGAYSIDGQPDNSIVLDAYQSGWREAKPIRWTNAVADNQGRLTIRLDVATERQCAYANALRIEGPMRISPEVESPAEGAN